MRNTPMRSQILVTSRTGREVKLDNDYVGTAEAGRPLYIEANPGEHVLSARPAGGQWVDSAFALTGPESKIEFHLS